VKFETPEGATPLDDETIKGLIPSIRTQGELNEFEANNIAHALIWAKKSRTLKRDLFSVSGLCLLHEKMFSETWTWAGKFRVRQTNIGVAPAQIQIQLGALLGDVKYWLDNKTYPLDEIGVRFHHRLVLIHPFPNGNGRFARIAADLLISHNSGRPFEWGGGSLQNASDRRRAYIQSLVVADRDGDYEPLLQFARST
jgi:Fic-DOC domain mobile mystery protein B